MRAVFDFLAKVRTLRWDDHRYYHQSRINQTLHLISAISFLVAYGLLFSDPALAGLVGWLVGMVSRQSGHIFFEPRGFDTIHNTTYEHKESIKAGYNMQRKAVLISVWLGIPLVLAARPDLFGLMDAQDGFTHKLGLLWLGLACAGVTLRTLQLFVLRGPAWGLAWAFKIVTDPFHNIDIYWRSPIALLRGQRLDPLDEGEHAGARA
jgi:hypothetical protein